MSYLICRKSITLSNLQSSVRLITYLHSGSRIRGLKRDPASYMTNPHGLVYGSLGSDYHSSIRSSLQLNKFEINIPDNLLLQCLTHKSFAHGSVPYNEKLDILGSHFLKLRASCYSIKPTLPQEADSAALVNGFNFNLLGSLENKQLIDKKRVGQLIKNLNLQNLVFWKMRNPQKGAQYNGEYQVLSTVLHSIIGAMLIHNGPEKTARFVDQTLFNKESKISLL